jgi:hypothetical protein
VDLIFFAITFTTLAIFIKIPKDSEEKTGSESVLKLAKEGLEYLKQIEKV